MRLLVTSSRISRFLKGHLVTPSPSGDPEGFVMDALAVCARLATRRGAAAWT